MTGTREQEVWTSRSNVVVRLYPIVASGVRIQADLLPENWSRMEERVRLTRSLDEKDRMSRKRYTPKQIIEMLREAEIRLSQGATMGLICRELGVSEQSYYLYERLSRYKRFRFERRRSVANVSSP